MKTLIATDGSPEASIAIRTASRLLRRTNNEVSVVFVEPAVMVAGAARSGRTAIPPKFRSRIRKETESILQNAQRVLGDDGISCKPITESGSPAKNLLRLNTDYDVTVVGATGKRDTSRLGIGPVASRIVEHGSGTVLVARELASENSWRALVATDGSESSRQALDVLTKYFNASSLDVTVMHVVESPWVQFDRDQKMADFPGDAFDKIDPGIQIELEMEREAETIVEQAEEQLDGYVLGLNSVIREGNPATEILGEAEAGGYDLIVLGAAGGADLKHQLLGSVSARVAAQAPCSVAVVKIEE